ncbi:uncharacterized protein BO97DRAFT_419195 [Aspergillus homomorphus CBS 101889]|uniref:Uncharacterized protein n=1 Tax=Aspergillus homomorphus (strain CBS 101889) TaxID=1450537 RepID=A0A395HKE4_ASPHC|nr:hypothetical protein BO97DRAFT_419195 [Aspergillus homomorphus CBS 101889]RAL06734.1 hypothetical protein BO97DRAFT_419195 [Aspergillus homomorphus CBS 101889]
MAKCGEFEAKKATGSVREIARVKEPKEPKEPRVVDSLDTYLLLGSWKQCWFQWLRGGRLVRGTNSGSCGAEKHGIVAWLPGTPNFYTIHSIPQLIYPLLPTSLLYSTKWLLKLVFMSPYLAVAIFHPRYGNFQHWALHLHTDTEDHLFEVDGEHPGFTEVSSHVHPRDIPMYIQSNRASAVGNVDVPTIQAVVDATPVDNETLEWDCQDYVLEILEGCEREAVIDDDDADYVEAMEILRNKRGPIL